MINLAEKLVWFFTILSIVFVAALILSKSNISEESVQAKTEALNEGGLPWDVPDDAATYVTTQPGGQPSNQPSDPANPRPNGAADNQPRTQTTTPQPPVRYDENNRRMPAYLTAGHWEGELFVVPEVKIDRSFQEKYSHKQDVVELLNTAYATYEEMPGGSIEVTLEKMNRTSPFRRLLGFQEGDRLMSINGQNIGGITGAWDMYETMKSNPSFEVEVLRDGQRVRFNYSIGQ